MGTSKSLLGTAAVALGTLALLAVPGEDDQETHKHAHKVRVQLQTVHDGILDTVRGFFYDQLGVKQHVSSHDQ
eukprot:scaffold2292_cov301-Pavlova_lutheri.AAC.4